MFNFLRQTTLLAAMAFAGTAFADERGADAASRAATANGERARVLVVLKDEAASNESIDARTLRIKTDVDQVLAALPGSAKLKRRFMAVAGFAVEVDAKGLAALAADPRVLSVGLDVGGMGSSSIAPDASSVLNQLSPLAGIGLHGSGMKIAVIDSGVDTDHVDLAGRIVDQQCFCAGVAGAVGCCPNGLDSQSGSGSAEDDHGHGTNVTGIILGAGAAAPRGALPQASLVSVKVLDANNSFCCISDVIAALDWVRINHPDVDAVNMSLGTFSLFSGNCDSSPPFNVTLSNALNNLRSVGATVTASSGNQANNISSSSPACLAATIGVGATWDGTLGSQTVLGCTDPSTAAKQITCFSNLNTTVDLFAAGAYVTSTGRNGATSTFAGTSQAAPMVAACASALKQLRPSATLAQIEAALKATPTTVSSARNGGFSYPFLDCMAAVRQLDLLFANGFQ